MPNTGSADRENYSNRVIDKRSHRLVGLAFGQATSLEADYLNQDQVSRQAFHRQLAVWRGRLLGGEDFVDLYRLDSGQPSLLTTVLLPPTYDRASDEEEKARTDIDRRRKVALGGEQLFANNTLQLFKA